MKSMVDWVSAFTSLASRSQAFSAWSKV